MRSRTVREGSVGLLILLGLILFGGMVAWLRNITLGKTSYTFNVKFDNAAGMQSGSAVRYRGVNVGRVTALKPTSDGVNATVEILQVDVKIPRNVVIEANQSSFIGEATLDIRPITTIPDNITTSPIAPNCQQSGLIICDRDNVIMQGKIGANFDELIRSTIGFTNAYSNPEFYRNVNEVLKNSAVATARVAELTRDISVLTRTAQKNLNDFSTATNSVTQATNRTAAQFSNTAAQFSNTASQIGNTAQQYSRTATEMNKLVVSLNSLVADNRSNLVSSLNNFSETSRELRDTVSNFKPTVNRFNTTFNRVNSDELFRNLETFASNAAKASENAAQASANLRDASKTFRNPASFLLLQRTLDSARVTFENAQKITSDLDKLTGDPAFVNNLRNLVNGLNKLVSSTQQLEQQIQVAQALEPINAEMNNVPNRDWVKLMLSTTPTKPEIPVGENIKIAPTPINEPFAIVPEHERIPSKTVAQPLFPTIVAEDSIKLNAELETPK